MGLSEAYEAGDVVKLVSTELEGEVIRVDYGDSLPYKVKFKCFTSFYEEKDIKLIKED